MDITKEFTPVTIRIETKEELRDLKELARKADKYRRSCEFYPYGEVASYEKLARQILDL